MCTNLEGELFAGDYGETLDHLAVDAQPEHIIGYVVIVLHWGGLRFFVQEIKVCVAFHRRRRRRRRGRTRHFGVAATGVSDQLTSRRDIISEAFVCWDRHHRRHSREGLGRRGANRCDRGVSVAVIINCSVWTARGRHFSTRYRRRTEVLGHDGNPSIIS